MENDNDKTEEQVAKVSTSDTMQAFLNGKEILPPNVSGPDPEVWGTDRWSP